jgi:hypothetical protein
LKKLLKELWKIVLKSVEENIVLPQMYKKTVRKNLNFPNQLSGFEVFGNFYKIKLNLGNGEKCLGRFRGTNWKVKEHGGYDWLFTH